VACNVQAATRYSIYIVSSLLLQHLYRANLPAENREANLACHFVVWQVAKIKYKTIFLLYTDIDFVEV
jgi:hypothetical protein